MATHLAEEGRRTRPRQPRTSPVPRGTRGAGCKMQRVSPVTADDFAGRGAHPASGAGRLMAGSDQSPELANSLALRLPASRLGRRWGALAPLADVVLRIPAGTTGIFRRDKAIFSSLRMAGESCIVEIALTKANSSCQSIMLRQEELAFLKANSSCGESSGDSLNKG